MNHPLVSQFSELTVLVIGDIMIDCYWWADVTRISPEAPVPIAKINKETHTLGGAGNLAHNISKLGATCILAGVVGNGTSLQTLQHLCTSEKIQPCLVSSSERPTIHKTRIMAQQQQIIRIDKEKTHPLSEKEIRSLKEKITPEINKSDIIIISDYSKGINNKEFIEWLMQTAKINGKKVVVDTKSKNYGIYKGADVITPNHSEASIMTGMHEEDEASLIQIGKVMQEQIKGSVIITRGSKGMTLFEKDTHQNIPTVAKEVYDVSGAGDTVTAVIALARGVGADLITSAKLATHAASVVVGKIGTTPCSQQELLKQLNENTI